MTREYPPYYLHLFSPLGALMAAGRKMGPWVGFRKKPSEQWPLSSGETGRSARSIWGEVCKTDQRHIVTQAYSTSTDKPIHKCLLPTCSHRINKHTPQNKTTFHVWERLYVSSTVMRAGIVLYIWGFYKCLFQSEKLFHWNCLVATNIMMAGILV